MAHPIRELSKMTTRSKNPDGMPFGGVAPDALEVAGALAMRHPDTGEKLIRHAYYLARLLYADDRNSRAHVKAGVMSVMIEKEIDLPDVSVAKLINCAIKEIQMPIMRLNRKTGEQEIKPTSKSEICRRLGVKGNKLPVKIEAAYNAIIQQLFTWNDLALRHISAAMREDEAA